MLLKILLILNTVVFNWRLERHVFNRKILQCNYVNKKPFLKNSMGNLKAHSKKIRKTFLYFQIVN